MTLLRGTATAGLLLAAAALPAQAKDTLTLGLSQFPVSLNPYTGAQTVQFFAVGFAQRPITAFAPDGRVACLLCAEVPTVANGLAKIEKQPDGTDGLAVTIKLRPDAAWGDGVPVTTKDLMFTWRIATDPKNGFTNVHPWARATKIDVVDDHTAVLHLPKVTVTYQLWDYLLPEHIEDAVYQRTHGGLDYINQTTYNTAPTTPGLWDGPFMVGGFRTNAQVDYVRNPNWKGTAPGLSRITLRYIDNTAALQANLLSGDVDGTPSGIGLSIDQVVAMQKDHPNDFLYIYKPGLVYERIDTQLSNPILADLRVRQALLLAIDRKTLINRLFGGYGAPALTWLNDNDSMFTPDVTAYPFDPARAKALLKDAGWTPGPDGILRNAKGDRLSLQFSTTAGNRVRELTQQVMQSQWKTIGVEVTIANQPSREFFGTLMKRREYTGLAEYANNTQIGIPPAAYYATAAIPTAANGFVGFNWSGWSNPQMDKDLAAAEVELDPAKAKLIWADMQKIYAEQLPELPLYFRVDPDVMPKWLKGYVATGKEDYVSYWAQDWHP